MLECGLDFWRWRGLDRVSCQLANNLTAALAIKNTPVDNESWEYLATITISPTKVKDAPSSEKHDG